MRRATTILAIVMLAAGLFLKPGASRRVLAFDNKLEMPKEAFGFSGKLSAEVVKAPDPVYGWFEIKVVKVVSLSSNNKTKIRSPNALTKAWKDKCVAVLGVKEDAGTQGWRHGDGGGGQPRGAIFGRAKSPRMNL